jgi:regulator of replication initiation timing
VGVLATGSASPFGPTTNIATAQTPPSAAPKEGAAKEGAANNRAGDYAGEASSQVKRSEKRNQGDEGAAVARQLNEGLQSNSPKFRDENLRRLMRSLGCDIPEVQNAVIEYIVQDTNSRQPLRDVTGKLFMAMRTNGVSDEQLNVLVNESRAAIETDKTRRTGAQLALRNKIGPQITPRLEAMLMLLGLQGDMVITAPNPRIVGQLEQERKKLRSDVDGLKIEVESLRRERDAARTERDECRNGKAAPAAGGYNAPQAAPAEPTELQKVINALRTENKKLSLENETLRQEIAAAHEANQ